jgi:dipeptidase D
MTNEIAALQPNRLWHYFLETCKIPRPSRHEGKMASYLENFANAHHLEFHLDETGNVLIRKPATPGFESRPGVILQSHMDMVCEKNADIIHDFEKDPINPNIQGGWVKAKGTTLGADDGIGIAASLAILEANDIEHGPLEALFTMDEETGLTGASGLKPEFLIGRILLNLDSEDEGQVFIGCAGGIDTVASIAVETDEVPENHIAFKASITGLKGGHSGDDINKGLGNAVKLMNRFLWNAQESFEIALADFNAGNLRNAIAREAFAIFTVHKELESELRSYSKNYFNEIKTEFRLTEPDVQFLLEPVLLPDVVFDEAFQADLLDALYACPHGVIAMSQEIPGFVETSTNLASVKCVDKKILITTSQRSSVESAKKDISDMVASVFYLLQADVEHSSGYPGWKPDANSLLLKKTVESYERLFHESPQVLVIHAGLECGLIGAIYPGMDMISFGPTIKGAHSPDERLEIASVQKFWDLTLEILRSV